MTTVLERLGSRLTVAVARTVPGRGDRWLPLATTVEERPLGPVDLHAPADLPGGVPGFLTAATPAAVGPEGVLDHARVRLDVTTSDGIASGVLRGRSGRPLRGPGGLLDPASGRAIAS